jgi:hypothetical protein
MVKFRVIGSIANKPTGRSLSPHLARGRHETLLAEQSLSSIVQSLDQGIGAACGDDGGKFIASVQLRRSNW